MKSYQNIYVLGGHELACTYLENLLKGRGEKRIDFKALYSIDPHLDCLARSQFKSDVLHVPQTYADFLSDLIKKSSSDLNQSLLIPDHTAPHVLFQVFLKLFSESKKLTHLKTQVLPFTEQLGLPYQKTLESGVCALSFANWTCPSDCDEPKICPAIKKERDWNLESFFKNYQKGSKKNQSQHFFYCKQLIDGICFLSLEELQKEWKVLQNQCEGQSPPSEFLVATFSKCHGILGLAYFFSETY